MPEAPTSNPKQFIQGAPVLYVEDPRAAAAFYRDILGFTCDFVDDGYAVVWRDNAAIHFTRAEGTPSGLHLFHWVRDVDAYYEEIVARGADVTVEPGDRPYDLRDFSVRDPHGVTLVFGQDL